MKKVVIAGGSGFLGQAVVKAFADSGYDVVVLSRGTKGVEGARVVRWDGQGPGAWYDEIDGSEAVVNLCGEPIVQRWTPASLARIRESRLGPTCLLGAAIEACKSPPRAWINTSAVGFYGSSGTREVSEASGPSDDFLGKLCRDWEAEVDRAVTPQTRKIKFRIGVVLGRGSGLFGVLSKLTKKFLGGALGDGKQYVPWIHIHDVAQMVVWAVQSDASGPLNATSPHPVTNADLMSAMRNAFGRPPIPGVPASLVQSLARFMGWDSSILLGGARVVPSIALAKGFKFKFVDLDEALNDLVDDVPHAWRVKTPV